MFYKADDCKRKSLPDLYSYTVRYDDGSAPNPLFGICTLAICKPGIRRTARPGDWVVGLGSKQYCRHEHTVYAMEVEQVLDWQTYDRMAYGLWPHRLPDTSSPDLAKHLGDCLYHEVSGAMQQRAGVHSGGSIAQRQKQQTKDLNGHVLISTRYLYFGSAERPLPTEAGDDLRGLVLGGQGHRRQSNAPLLSRFVRWYEGLERELGNGQHGWPRLLVRGQHVGYGNRSLCFDHDDGDEDDAEVC